MTARLTRPLATNGEAAAPMPTAWSAAISPTQFAAGCSWIMANKHGEAAHMAFDLWSNLTLSSLGYSEGVAMFLDGVKCWHEQRLAEEVTQ